MFSFFARLIAKLFKTEVQVTPRGPKEDFAHMSDAELLSGAARQTKTQKTETRRQTSAAKPASKSVTVKPPELKAPPRTAARKPVMRPPEWDIHESVFLLAEYLTITQDNKPLDEIAWRISLDLRRMAKNRGLTIDDTYRSEKGIINRLRGIEAAYTGKSGAAPVLRQFVKAVDLYRKERERYSKILDEAKYMVVGVPNAGRQPAWDICESVLLLDGYLEAAQGKSPQDEIVTRVSADLRRMAANRGRLINSVYRDEKEIVCRMYNIAYAYKGETVFMPEVEAFGDAVEMYYSDRQRYLETLEQAKAMAAGGQDSVRQPKIKIPAEPTLPTHPASIETRFYDYLLNVAGLARSSCESYVYNIRKAERYAAEHGCKSCSLYSEDKQITRATAAELYSDPLFIAYNKQQHGRLSAAIDKLLQFLGIAIPRKAAPHAQQTRQRWRHEAI